MNQFCHSGLKVHGQEATPRNLEPHDAFDQPRKPATAGQENSIAHVWYAFKFRDPAAYVARSVPAGARVAATPLLFAVEAALSVQQAERRLTRHNSEGRWRDWRRNTDWCWQRHSQTTCRGTAAHSLSNVELSITDIITYRMRGACGGSCQVTSRGAAARQCPVQGAFRVPLGRPVQPGPRSGQGARVP